MRTSVGTKGLKPGLNRAIDYISSLNSSTKSLDPIVEAEKSAAKIIKSIIKKKNKRQQLVD